MRLLLYSSLATPKWRNGRRDGLKHRWGLPHVGSIPTFGTFGGILANHFISLYCGARYHPCGAIIAALSRTRQSLHPKQAHGNLNQMHDALGGASDPSPVSYGTARGQNPESLYESHMSEHRSFNRGPMGLRSFILLLVIVVFAAACSSSGGGSGSATAREAALRQIAAEYARTGDLEQAQIGLDRLNLANPGQLLVSLSEADIAAGRAREEIEATAALAEILGARSQKLTAYLSPTMIHVPTQEVVLPTEAPTVVVATIEPPSPVPPSPTRVDTATSAPTATEPPPTASSTPEPQEPRVIADSNVNLRSGPGRAYPVIGQLRGGQEMPIIGRNASGDWWQIESAGASQAWVAGTVVRVLGTIDTVAVAKNIPAPPTAAPRPTAAPQPTAPPAEVDYRVVEVRMLSIQENGGCMGNHNFFVQVVDPAGAPVNGAVVRRVWAPQETAISGAKDCYWAQNSKDEGCAEFDAYGAGDNLLMVSDPVLGAVTSETSRTVSTKDVDITVDELMATGYCPEGRANCEWRKNPGGDLPPQLCNGHYSWFVKFQRTR